MNARDPLDALAKREAEFARVSRRSIRRSILYPVVGFTLSLWVISEWFGTEFSTWWWPVPIVPAAIGFGVSLGGMAVWRRFRPAVAWPGMMGGLPRRDRRAIWIAMWRGRPLDDTRLLPVVEDVAYRTQRTKPLWISLVGVYFGLAALIAVAGSLALAAAVVALAIVTAGQFVFVMNRGRLVARLTSNRQPPSAS